ncbi:hypothetical protein JCGZ_17345 [Jatropha curcas]|uniref:Protein FLC EXPRESSOR n=1 Tax=Jatropha curcas TaxID=180498 RepID=A0A067LEW0_JATCU|nr:protein FLX-like 1 [Jatropha curcas]KDP45738.1 hypothetical protein JCGZ_17345 [Jatropha curcas]
MAGRNHLSSNALKLRQIPIDDLRLNNPLTASIFANTETSRWPHHPSTILEDRIATQHRQIQSLFLENQKLASTHVTLKQELALAEEELRRSSVAAADIKAERDDQVRKVYERSLQMDAELRSIDALRTELVQVRMDVDNLTMYHQELTAELKAINSDLAKARMEADRVPAIKAEIENMQREIQRGRAAIQYEKKTHVNNLEHGKTMEQNMLVVGCEIEKLHAELSNVEKKARAANPSPGYAGSYSNPEVACGGNPCPDPYAMHQVQGVTNGGAPFVSG